MPSHNTSLGHGAEPLRSALVVGAPLSLAVLEIFHPHPHDLFQLDLRAWLLVHYLQIALFPLSALAVVVLIRNSTGAPAWLCRVAMFIFAASFVAFDTAAGVVTGILVKAAKASGNPDVWQAPVRAVWEHPIIGGAPGTTPVLAAAGSISWLIGGLMASICVRRKGASWLPVGLLVVSAFGLSVFKTHAWPGGPVTFGALAIAAALVEIGV